MNLNLYIAKKIKTSSNNTIACASVAISILVMFMAMVISDGFKREIKETSVGFSGEVFLLSPGQDITNQLYPISGRPSYIDKIHSLKGIESVNDVAYTSGMLKSDESVQGIMFKGVDSTYSLDFFEKYLVEGTLPDFSGKSASNQILISERLASLMNYKCGDKITAYFVGESVRVRRFTISGLYNVRLDEMDKTLAIVDIRQTRRLNGWESDQVSNIEIKLAAGANADKICREIEEIILDRPWDDDSVIASQIRYIYPHIFDWLDLLNMNVLIILILMIVVAGFNMISGLLIILFEKISMIGLLKALGMKTRDICRVFIYRGSFIVIKGMVIGNVIAIILSILQGVFHIIPLDPANYFVDHVPVYVNVPKIVILNVASFALMILIMIIPSFFIARVQPEKTIKVS
ncbi:MAG: ABC transporter permease [Bacteroidales bacterium]|nr:ABC transporter permease [Bacteroidales bacterium]